LKIVLGLTGPNAAGKGEVADYLKTRGFTLYSLSNIVREEAEARSLPPEREHLIAIGNDLRREGGPSVLADRLIPRLADRDVVDSIRNPAEVQALRQALPHFTLIGVAAATEVRFRRSLARARPGDPGTLELFEARERQENSDDPNAQQLAATFEMADRIIWNDSDLDSLHLAVDRLLELFR
jgi:dephospho-CoA kinase